LKKGVFGGMANKKRTYTDPLVAAMAHFMRLEDLTQDEMAKAIGYKNRNMISAMLGERTPGAEPKRRAIAKHFGYGYDEFLNVGQKIINGEISIMSGKEIIASIDATLPSYAMQATATNTPPEPCLTCNHPVKMADVIEEKHGHVIQQFQDRETALKINEMLVAIEKADRDLYMKLFGKIESAFEDIDDEKLKKTGTDGLPG
jgi:plasmid maintenance system antidote protein VapI